MLLYVPHLSLMALHFLGQVEDPITITTQVTTYITQYQCLCDTVVVIIT